MRRALAIALLLPVAGCFDAAPAGEAADAPAPAVAGPLDPRFVFVTLPEFPASEPNVLVAPDGTTVYVVAPTPEDGAAVNRLWRSDGGGATWRFLTEVAPEYLSGDADVSVGRDGDVWISTLEIKDPTATLRAPLCTAVSLSKDKGETFETNPLACPAPPVYWDRPWINKGDQFAYVLAWHPDMVIGGLVAGLSRSADNRLWTGGPAFLGPTPEVINGKPAVDGGRIFVPYTEIVPQGLVSKLRGPAVAEADEPGILWSARPIADDHVSGNFPVAAVHSGKGIMTWMAFAGEERDSPNLVRAALYEDGRWSEAFTLDGNGTNAYAWAAARDGHVAAAWLHADADTHPNKAPANATWTLRVWVDGALYEAVDADVHRGPVCVIILGFKCEERSRDLGDYLSVDLLPDGRPIVAYVASTAPDQPEYFGQLRLATLKEAPSKGT